MFKNIINFLTILSLNLMFSCGPEVYVKKNPDEGFYSIRGSYKVNNLRSRSLVYFNPIINIHDDGREEFQIRVAILPSGRELLQIRPGVSLTLKINEQDDWLEISTEKGSRENRYYEENYVAEECVYNISYDIMKKIAYARLVHILVFGEIYSKSFRVESNKDDERVLSEKCAWNCINTFKEVLTQYEEDRKNRNQ